MKISAIRSDKVYSKIMNAPLDKKNDIYRYELMKPFPPAWYSRAHLKFSE